MRKRYLDNLRAICILWLFPFHVFMIYNDWGEPFYVHGASLSIPSAITRVLWLWMMPLLFVISGMSARYALQRRSAAAYAKERAQKLLIPLLAGAVFLLPVQAYIGGLNAQGAANYWDYYTKLTDFTGYDGAFTPGHLWFMLFLFVISMIALPLTWRFRHSPSLSGRFAPSPRTLLIIMLMGTFPTVGNMLFDISGKSPTEYLAFFLLGYFVLSDDAAQEMLDRYRFWLLGIALTAAVCTFTFDNILFEEAAWLSVLAILGLGRHYLNFTNRAMQYLTDSSFGVYLFHQTWIVIAGHFVLQWTENSYTQIPLILFSSVLLTYGAYEAARRFAPTRRIFGLKR